MYQYWEDMWKSSEDEDFSKYIRPDIELDFIKIFKEREIVSVCDAASGFGKYSVILGTNNFEISGFDVSEKSIEMTKTMLDNFKLNFGDYKVCSITDISFDTDHFDGVVSRAVIDHLDCKDVNNAINELLRIVKPNGLIYLTFDGLSEDDVTEEHDVIDGGAFLYKKGTRKGMIFKYYKTEEILELFKENEIVFLNTKSNGEREIIIKKN